MVKIDERDLYQLLVSEFRYAVTRDNHLAPSTCVQHIKNYLPEMSTKWRSYTAKQLSEEIINERLLNSHYTKPDFKFENINNTLSLTPKKQLNEDRVWEEVLVFLTDYLENLPSNVNRYMEHIYGRMTYSKGIDYYSAELMETINKNINKK